MSELPKRSVLITGCSEGGIGSALAQEYHRRGLRVFATVRTLAKAKHLQDAGLEVLPLDVADPSTIRGAVEAVSRLTGGTLDILVNNAGGGYQMPILDADLDEARRLFDVNVWGLLAVTQAFAPLLVASASKGGKPRVVNIGSVAGRQPAPWQGIYNATKGALFMLNDNMRLELRPLGIEVLHVVTGGIATKFFANATGQKLPATSLYGPVAALMEANVGGHRARETQSMTPETYARKVVSNTLSSWPTTTMWIGGMASICWAGMFLWDGIQDLIIQWMFGLDKLKVKFREAMERGKKEQGVSG